MEVNQLNEEINKIHFSSGSNGLICNVQLINLEGRARILVGTFFQSYGQQVLYMNIPLLKNTRLDIQMISLCGCDEKTDR